MVVVRFLIPHEIKIELEIWPAQFLPGHGVTRSRIIFKRNTRGVLFKSQFGWAEAIAQCTGGEHAS